MADNLIPLLKALHRAEGASLFRYLHDSPSYIPASAHHWLPLLKTMTTGAADRLARLEHFLESNASFAEPVSFPSSFASLHYSSLDYLLGRLLNDKRTLASLYSRASQAIDSAPATAPIAEFVRLAAATHASDLAILESFRPPANPRP